MSARRSRGSGAPAAKACRTSAASSETGVTVLALVLFLAASESLTCALAGVCEVAVAGSSPAGPIFSQAAWGTGPMRPASASAGQEGRVCATFADSAMSVEGGMTGQEWPPTAPVGPDRTVTGTVTGAGTGEVCLESVVALTLALEDM